MPRSCFIPTCLLFKLRNVDIAIRFKSVDILSLLWIKSSSNVTTYVYLTYLMEFHPRTIYSQGLRSTYQKFLCMSPRVLFHRLHQFSHLFILVLQLVLQTPYIHFLVLKDELSPTGCIIIL